MEESSTHILPLIDHQTSKDVRMQGNRTLDHFKVTVLERASDSSGFQGALTCVLNLFSFI